MPMPCSDHAVLLKATVRRSRDDLLCRGREMNGMVREWYGCGMASVNQTRPHCVNQMGKTHSKPLAARHGRGTACARHAMCESVLRVESLGSSVITTCLGVLSVATVLCPVGPHSAALVWFLLAFKSIIFQPIIPVILELLISVGVL